MSQRSLFNTGSDEAAHKADLAAKHAAAHPELQRVSGKIADRIRVFMAEKKSREWHMSDLHEFVQRSERVAPASCDRILRMMRKSSELNYEVINRQQSLYKFT